MFSYLNERIDLRLLAITLLLAVIGLASVYSAVFDAHMPTVYAKQVIWMALGIVVMMALWATPLRFIQFISFPAYFGSLALLLSVLLIGRTVSGSTSWFNLGVFRLQPAEFAKISTAMALAQYLSRSDVSLKNLRNLTFATGIVAAPMLLIMLQPDFGTAVIFGGLFFPVLYWAGASRFTLLSIIGPIVVSVAALLGTSWFLVTIVVVGVLLFLTRDHNLVAAVVFSLTVLLGISVQFVYDGLKPYQQKRIYTFLNPNADPLGAGYNILQSKVAIGSGGPFGKGYLKGTQTQLNFIPEQWTDFIFCVPGEEFGFVGAVSVIGLSMWLLARGVSIASIVKNRYSSILAIGVTGILAAHMLINLGMAVGLMPVVGVPLPFLSYGGSFVITTLCIMGILLNLHAHRKEY
ncbi:MAG TPA: rod shape-determining protein RodA [Bacteroidota bacterium]|nr:rod shape-determining protein RodA [Bacteroidota bacterium]